MAESIGPALPPGFKRQSDDKHEDECYGPQPPNHQNKLVQQQKDEYNPSLPPTLESSQSITTSARRFVGPSLPPHMLHAAKLGKDTNELLQVDDDSEDEFVGPLPSMAAPADVHYDAGEEFTARMKLLEDAKNRESELQNMPKGREEWMTSLPTLGLAKDIGLTSRQFRKDAALSQDESWTKAPIDSKNSSAIKEPQGTQKRSYEKSKNEDRDKEISRRLENYNKEKRDQSLVDIHAKKLKIEKEKAKNENEDGKARRVPFNRETDLQVNRFDEAQRKSILKKAAQLDSRFGHGSQKYE